MAQKITIRMAGKDFVLKATGPENEEMIRLAAIEINQKTAAYQNAFPGKELSDILSFVALNEAVTALSLRRELDARQEEAQALGQSLAAYLSAEKP